jgi:hypothetical protein
MNTPQHQSSEILSSVHNATFETWIPFYAKRSDLRIEIDNDLPAPAAVPDTTEGERPRIMINPQFCMERFNFTPSEFLVVLFHEIEHLIEDAELKSTPEGRVFIEKRSQKKKQALENIARLAKEKKEREANEEMRRLKARHELENVLRDMYVNEQVVNVKKVPALR